MKKLKIVLFILLFTTNFTSAINEVREKDLKKKRYSSFVFEFTYVSVFKEGIWWIYVYNEDGILVNEYPAE